MSDDAKDAGPQPGGPVYEAGDARAVRLGWMKFDDEQTESFRVVLEFPQGPPKLPMSVVWQGTPLTISIKQAT